MATSPYRSWVEISREQIARNFRALRTAVGPAVEVVPVVKADAYRHGAIEISRIVVNEGARWLAVSSVDEGVALRQAGFEARILVMADFLPVSRIALLDFGLTPVLHDLGDLHTLDELARLRNQQVHYHLKIDSGMGRLGTRAPAAQVCEAVANAKHAQLEGLMTHFASAADYTTAQTEQQAATFAEVCRCMQAAGLEPRYVHLSSTIPIAYGRQDCWQSMVRPGHALYGYVSPARGEAPPLQLDVQPALTWKAAVLAVKDIEEGALIGYGGMYRAPKPMRIAVLAAGYADGIPHKLSNRGRVLAGGRNVPMLGAVSMDLTTIDVTDYPAIQVGEAVTLLGEENGERIDAQDIARVAETISYSVLCGISARVKRIYI